MKKLILPFFLFLAVTAFGQNRKFNFGLALNAGISDNFITGSSLPAGQYKDLEQPRQGYYGYLFTQYPLNLQSRLQIGIGYSYTGFQDRVIKYQYATPEPTAPTHGQFSLDYHDVMAPILYRRQFSARKNGFYLIGGITPLFTVRREKIYKAWYENGSISKSYTVDQSTEFRRLNINGTLGVGYAFSIGGKTNLFIQPTFDCNLLGVSKAASVNRRIYLIGLNLGLVI